MKKILSSFMVLLMISAATGCSGKVNTTKNITTTKVSEATDGYTHVSASAKYPEYTSADAVRKDSKLIVEGEKLSGKVYTYGEKDAVTGYTLSEVRVLKIVKNSEDKKVAVGDMIKVVEGEWVDETNKVVHHDSNYTSMKNNKKYRLFLGYDSSYGTYYPLGLMYGKIPSDKNEKRFYGNFNEYDDLLSELYRDFE